MSIRIKIKNKGGLFFELIKYHVIFYTFCSVSTCPYVNSYKVTKVITDFSLGIYNNPSGKTELLRGLKNNMNRNLKKTYCKCYESLFDTEAYKDFDIEYISAECSFVGDDVKISFDVHYSIKPGESAIFSDEQRIKKQLYDKLQSPSDKLLAKLVIIYNMLGFETGQFWGLHPNFYNKISESYKDPMECFASPFNHNLKNYYSPVPKIDKKFGSSGNFFKKFPSAKNDCYVMNPPFVEDIISKVFTNSLTKLNESTDAEITIYYYLPYWQDMLDPFIDKLKENGYYCRHHLFQKGTTFVYDYINSKKYPNVSFELILIQATNSSTIRDGTISNDLFNNLLKTLSFNNVN